jgi:hypothetical protein
MQLEKVYLKAYRVKEAFIFIRNSYKLYHKQQSE